MSESSENRHTRHCARRVCVWTECEIDLRLRVWFLFLWSSICNSTVQSQTTSDTCESLASACLRASIHSIIGCLASLARFWSPASTHYCLPAAAHKLSNADFFLSSLFFRVSLRTSSWVEYTRATNHRMRASLPTLYDGCL